MLFVGLLLACNRQTPPVQTEPAGAFSGRPKNIILVIGDGFALSQLSAMIYENNNTSCLESFPVVGLHKATAADNLITDSAAGATAFACGCKTYNAAIGVNVDTIPCKTILEQAESRGMATGLIATSPITHATPAAFFAHQPLRVMNEAIAADLLNTEIDLLIAGGQRYFSRRKDDKNLLNPLKKKGYDLYSYFDVDLLSIRTLNRNRNFAYFSADNQPLSAISGRKYLPHAVHLSLPYLKNRSDVGFFVMIEGSQIDWAGHAKDGPMMIEELIDFEESLKEVVKFAKRDRETLVIVTGDHETGGTTILPESKFKRVKLAFSTNGHTAALVPVFAYGPKAEVFRGIYDNTQIYYKMVEALGWKE